jgi:hypothetical protein
LFYEIPIEKRHIGDCHGFSEFIECVEINGRGVYVYGNNKEELTPEYVRKCLVGITKLKRLIEASSPQEAIDFFHSKYRGAIIGGNGRKDKAAWIDETESILELPNCHDRHVNENGDLICGPEVGDNGNGEFGMCVLEGFDPPSHNCPVSTFLHGIADNEGGAIETQEIGGFKVVRLISILKRNK